MSTLAFSSTETIALSCQDLSTKKSVTIKHTDEQLVLNLEAPKGTKILSLFDGNVTEDLLNFLRLIKTELKMIENRMEIRWPITNCRKDNEHPELISCDTKGTITFPENTDLIVDQFFTSKLEEETPNFRYKLLKIRLFLTSKKNNFTVAIPFYPEHCLGPSIK